MGSVTIKAAVNEERDIEKVWYKNNEKGESLQVIGNYEKTVMVCQKPQIPGGG